MNHVRLPLAILTCCALLAACGNDATGPELESGSTSRLHPAGPSLTSGFIGSGSTTPGDTVPADSTSST